MPRRNKDKAARRTVNTLPFYVFLVLMFIAYLLTQNTPALSVIFGALAFVAIIALLFIEIMNGIREAGFKKNILEIVIAVVAVVGIWFLLRIVLNTAYPLDVVPSCSMLPALQRGDMILVQGANIGNLKAPIVNVNKSAFLASFANTGSEALQCVAYNQTRTQLSFSQFVKPGYSIGLLESGGAGSRIVPYSAQDSNLVKYICGVTNATFQNKTVEKIVYTSGITIGNLTITGDKNNSIIVYQTIPQDLFYRYGDSYIVHRAYAILNVSGSYYVLTKGDNNPGLDIQYFNAPPNLTQVGGKVVGSLPYIGYIKLILSSSFVEPTGCNFTTGG